MKTRENIWPFDRKATSARNATPASGGIAARGGKRPSSGGGSRRSGDTAPAKSAKLARIDADALAAHYARGGTLAEFLAKNPHVNPAACNPTWSGRRMTQAERDAAYLEEDEDRAAAERHAAWAREQESKQLPTRRNITDRAKRYRAQKNVTGPRKCVICGSTRRKLDVMHLSGDESDGDGKNLGYGCRPCNAKLAHAFKRIGAGVPTRQYNPAKGGVPTFAQYAWAVSQGGPGGRNNSGVHDEAGAIIHATPKSKRIDYARKIAEGRTARSRLRDDERWNPADTAAAGYEEFHGAPPSEFVEVRERSHAHQYLSGAGILKRLVVAAIDGKAEVTLKGFGKRCLLAFNEAKTQLFIVGGDQSVDLAGFGIDPDGAHELETLGRVLKIDYFTTKEHLGDEGGEAIYRHGFRMTNENGRHVTVRVARYPDLIYRVRDEKLEFSGGSYTILAEGIDR